MPATYQIDASRNLVISKATGVVTAADLFAHQARLRSDPMFQPEGRQLVDFTEAIEVQLTSGDIRCLANESPWRAGARRAIVVPRPLYFGLARMFQIITEDHGVDLRLFDRVSEALQWLGLEP